MNTINEVCLAWYMWVNGNYDILIMTITLIVVAGLVLEVVRLNREIVSNYTEALNDHSYLCGKIIELKTTDKDQVKVNVHLAEDIVELQKKLKRKK